MASWALTALVFISPLFFLPTTLASFQFTKMFLMYIAVILAVVGWMIGRLSDGTLHYPKNWTFGILGIGLVIYLVSSIFSPAKMVSFFGQGNEVGTFFAILMFSVALYLSSQYFSSNKKLSYLIVAFVLSSLVVVTFQALRIIIGPGFLSLGAFNFQADTLIGSWNDMGVFVGISAILSFITLELLPIKKNFKWLFVFLLVASLFILSVVGFAPIWYVIGALALVFFVYNFSFRQSRESAGLSSSKSVVPISSLIVLIIALLFVLSKGNLYNFLANDLKMSYFNRYNSGIVTVQPTWYGTYVIAQSSIVKHPILGVGPNRYVNEWQVSKPQAINLTDLWSADFGYGIGFLPSLTVTIGVFGFLAFLAFFAMVLFYAYKVLFAKISDPFERYISVVTTAVTVYLWIFAIIYVPSPVQMTMLFIFTGALLGKSMSHGFIKTSEWVYAKEARSSFVVVLGLVFVMLGSIVSGYMITKKYVGSVFFTQAMAKMNTSQDISGSQELIIKASRSNNEDVYFRAIAEIELFKVNQILSSKDVTNEIIQTQAIPIFGNARKAAEDAIKYDRTNYENWMLLGKIFETVMPIAGDDAFNNAMVAYGQAKVLNPLNPTIPLVMARLNLSHKDPEKAKQWIVESLKLKGNYVDAIFFYAQMQVNQGDIKGAIQSVLALAQVSPNEPGLFFQLGLLYYNDKDYESAISAFKRSIDLVPNYANAKYFLGLSYDKIGKTSLAIEQFEGIVQTNPGNDEVNLIIKNLRAGRDPFANAKPPIDNKPEKRSTPPIKEDTADEN